MIDLAFALYHSIQISLGFVRFARRCCACSPSFIPDYGSYYAVKILTDTLWLGFTRSVDWVTLNVEIPLISICTLAKSHSYFRIM
ncbi:hypothetical protein PORCAN_1158 [Porphyromonas crevioricanis JCM 13913]|nr:hypothetical protein PORCAN_1158 [Porphyromonas crevioricanis JCM 13913]